MDNLLLTSFTIFPTQPPFSTSYVCGLLRGHDIEVQQLDLNMIIWDHLLSYNFIHGLQFNSDRVKKAKCPLIFPSNKWTFEYKKEWVLSNIETAKNILRDKELFFNMECLKWAMSVIFYAQKIIYYHYGAFITNKLTYWPQGGFSINSLSDIYDLSSDKQSNPFIEIIKEAVLPKVLHLKPKRIFIDTIFPWDIVQLLTLTRIFKKNIPGGVHLNFMGCGFDEMSFSRLRDRIGNNKKLFFGFDSIFLSRNDQGLIDLAKGKTDFSCIENLAFIDKDNSPVCNVMIKRTEPMQNVVPDYTDLDLSQYFVPYTVFIDKLSEMCYWNKCKYCSINSTKSRYFNYDTKFILQKIQQYSSQYGVNRIWFLDEACKPEQAEELADILLQENQKILWSLRTRISKELDKKLLKKLYKSGLRELWLGLETISPELLKDMRKTPIPDEYADTFKQILSDCSNIGIGIHACLLLGYPTETKEHRKALLSFFKEIKPFFASMPFFVTFNEFGLMYDSYVYKNQKQFGIIHTDENLDSYNMISIPYRTVSGNDSLNPKYHKQLDKVSKRILGTILNDPSLLITWFNVTDSPYELLFKENVSRNRKNPFVRGNFFSNNIRFFFGEILDNIPYICKLRDIYLQKKIDVFIKEYSNKDNVEH